MTERQKNLMALGYFSGLLSGAPVLLFIGLGWLPGAIFALLVVAPWAWQCRLLQAWLCVPLAVVGYHVAVHLVFDRPFYMYPLAGAAGAAVMLAPALVATPWRMCYSVLLCLCVATLAACLIPLAGVLSIVVGIAVWQIAVAYSLAVALEVGPIGATANSANTTRYDE